MVRRKVKDLCIIIGLLIFSFFSFIAAYYIGKNEYDNKKEATKIEEFFKEEDEYVPEDTTKTEESEKEEIKEVTYTFILEIPKIGLKKGFYGIGIYSNTVSQNIMMLNKSDYPNKDKGNVMLAAHNGSSAVSFFDKLDKTDNGDKVFLYYQGIKYEYILSNRYDIPKTGTAKIYRDYDKNTITLITCKKNTKDKQVVYIGYLNNKTNY